MIKRLRTCSTPTEVSNVLRRPNSCILHPHLCSTPLNHTSSQKYVAGLVAPPLPGREGACDWEDSAWVKAEGRGCDLGKLHSPRESHFTGNNAAP